MSLKLVVGNGKYNTADVLELPLGWDQPFDPKKEKSYKGVFQTMSRIFRWLTDGVKIGIQLVGSTVVCPMLKLGNTISRVPADLSGGCYVVA